MNKKVLTLLGSVAPGKFGEGGFMYRQVIPFLVITLLLLALGAPSTALAGGAITETAAIGDGGTVTLVFNNGQLTAKIRAKNLRPGHVYSVWGRTEGVNSNSNLSGGKARRDGSGNFTGHATVPVDPPFSFKVTINHHGVPIPGLFDDQKSTPKTGCTTNNPPGPNVCGSVSVIIPIP